MQLWMLFRNMRNIAVILTYGMTLDDWEINGQFDREFRFLSELQRVSNCKLTIIEHWTSKSNSFCYKRLHERGINRISIAPLTRPKSKVIAFLLNLIFSLLLIRYKYDLIFTNQIKGSWSLWLMKIYSGQKFVARSGYSWYMFSKRRDTSKIKNFIIFIVTKITYALSHQIIVSSTEDLRECCDVFNIKENKISIARNWVRKEKLKNNIERNGFLVVSRLVPEKRVLELLKIWQSENNLTIVGDGPDFEKVKPFVDELNLTHIHNLINNELLDLMKTKEYFILNSEYEGTPKVALEALACGLKVFMRFGPGSRELIQRSNCIKGYNNEEELENLLRNVSQVHFPEMRFRTEFTDKEHSLRKFVTTYNELIKECA